MKYYIILFLLTSLFILSSCNKKNDTETASDDIKKKELELKEKELKLKEEELMRKREENVSKKEQELNKTISTDLNGIYHGSIKDGTSWEVTINGFNGKTFSGFNIVYWKSTPEGYKTSFTGDYEESTGNVTMYEDKKAKGSGTFHGKLSIDGKQMAGDWYRYTDGGSFT